jgi:hypothetical protein
MFILFKQLNNVKYRTTNKNNHKKDIKKNIDKTMRLEKSSQIESLHYLLLYIVVNNNQ